MQQRIGYTLEGGLQERYYHLHSFLFRLLYVVICFALLTIVFKFDGTGTLYFYGSVYKGEWFNSMKHGVGKITYATGDAYDGQWENDMPSNYPSFSFYLFVSSPLL